MSEEMKTVIPAVDTPVITMKKLLEAGVHFGHQTRRWNPKMKKYIYTARNGIYIIDLAKTAAMISTSYKALKEIVDNGGKVLFVGTKKQCQEIIKEEALRSGSFYVTTRWLGGTLTNFKTIQKRIKYLKDIEKMAEDGTFNVLPKKEVAQYLKEQEKLEKVLGGIKEMRKLPNAIFVVDPRVELNAVLEARRLKIPVFGIVDTNSDPDLVDFIIPGNDDANKSVKLIATVVADAVVESKGGQPLVAYTKDEGSEVSMNDAIANVDKVEEAKRLARQQAHEEYRSRQFDRNRSGDRPRTYNNDRPGYNSDRPRTPRPYTPRPTTTAPTTPVVAEKVEVKVVKEGE